MYGSTRKIECIKDIYSIILTLLKFADKKYLPTDKRQKISPAFDYIAKNYHKEITNDLLAQLTGTSPIAYVHELRIKKTREILESDYGTITDIAYSLGYLNIYDFSRDFKKHVGVSPSKYVKSL